MIRSPYLNTALIITNIQTVVELLVFHCLVGRSRARKTADIKLILGCVKLFTTSFGVRTLSEFTLNFDGACAVQKDIRRSICLWSMRSREIPLTQLYYFSSILIGIAFSISKPNLLSLTSSILVISYLTTLTRSLLAASITWVHEIAHLVHIDTSNIHNRHVLACSAVFLGAYTGSGCTQISVLLGEGIHDLSPASWALMSLCHFLLNKIGHVFVGLRIIWILCLPLLSGCGSIRVADDLGMCSVVRITISSNRRLSAIGLWGSLLLKRGRPWLWVSSPLLTWTTFTVLNVLLLIILILNATLVQNNDPIPYLWRFRRFRAILRHIYRVLVNCSAGLLLVNAVLNAANIWVVS